MARPKKTTKKAVKKMTRKPRKKKEVAVVNQKAPLMIKEQMTEKKIIEAFDMLGITSRLKDEKTKKLFIAVAKQNNLNPLNREIHAVEVWDSYSGNNILVPVTGYQVYIKRAEETGHLEYWYPVEDGSIKVGNYRAGVIIKRRG